MDKKTAEYMGSRVDRFRELEVEIKETKKLIEKLIMVNEDTPSTVYIDGKSFELTPRMIKEVKYTLKNEYDLVVLENEKEMEDI